MATIQILIYIFSIIPFSNCANNQLGVEFISYRNEYNRDYIKLNTIQLINYEQRLALNGTAIYRRDIYKHNFKAKVWAAQTTGTKYWKLLETSGDGCAVLEDMPQKSYNLVHKILVDAKSFGNLVPKKCPIVKNYEYNVRNFIFNANNFPIRLPNVVLNVTIDLLDNKITFYRGILVLNLTSKRFNAQKEVI